VPLVDLLHGSRHAREFGEQQLAEFIERLPDLE
jgi:hypothetical protein